MSLSLAVTAGAAYTDGDKISDDYAVAVEVASQLGILEGFEDGSYGPQQTLTRAQLATMVYRLTTADVTDVYTANFAGGAAEAFSDTAATAWYAGYVGYAADAELLKGLGDGTYAPNDALTGYAALAAFLRGVGYDEPGYNFVGADWTVEVAKVAKQVGALEGISGVDLNKAISREVAAQMIYNIMFSDMVAYTPAFGYQPDISFDLKDQWFDLDAKTLAYSEFDIVTEKKGADDNIAPWGRPVTEWNDKDGDAVVTIAAKPVAEYKTAVTECQIATDLGLNELGDVVEANEYKNGAVDEVIINNIDPKDTTNKVGAQGTLTEIYLVDEKYEVVQIETWLAKATATAKATYDKAGHELTPATATFDIYGLYTDTLETADYAVDDYALVNLSKWNDGKDYKGETYFLTETAPVATAKLNSFDSNKAESVLGGTTYDWAAKYVLRNPGVAGTEYDVFVDFYGNLIGLEIPASAAPQYTVLESGIKVTNGFDPYYAAKIVDLSDGTLDEIVVDTFNALTWKDDAVTYPHCIVSYTSDEDGYDLHTAADKWGTDYTIEKGTPTINIDGNYYVTDANTVYAVETKCGEYEIYTGYANVPSMSADYTDNKTHIEILWNGDEDKYVDLVYVDASGAVFADKDTYAYIIDNAYDAGDGKLESGTEYDIYANIVVGGEVVNVRATKNCNLADPALDGKAVMLKVNAEGLVYAVDTNLTFYHYTVAENNSNEVIYFAESTKGFLVDEDTTIWIVDRTNDLAEVGTADDLDLNVDCRVKIDADGKTLDKVIIFDTIQQ